MSKSSIEWTEITWNPTTGCNKVSSGCKNCYAELLSHRLKAMGIEKYKNGFEITIHEDTLEIPFSWKGKKVVFVNSMSDLFHEKVPLDFIQNVFEVMNKTPQHTYQVLTKRSERLIELSPFLNWSENIWMGVSVEDQKVIHRIKNLENSGAAVKFLSIEPLIGPVKVDSFRGIDWVIVGGESGPKARPLQKKWVEDIREKCLESNVAFFFKQWGKTKFNVNPEDPTISKEHPNHAKGGCQLDGEIYREMPSYEPA